MAYSAAAVANAFIDIAAEKGFRLTNLKLQKLVYFAHGWYLAFTGTPLINESVQSWKYGPVISELYSDLRHYGSDFVTKKISVNETIPETGNEYNFLKDIFDKYGMFSPAELIALTHEENSPWAQFGAGQSSYMEIPNANIQAYFTKLINP